MLCLISGSQTLLQLFEGEVATIVEVKGIERELDRIPCNLCEGGAFSGHLESGDLTLLTNT